MIKTEYNKQQKVNKSLIKFFVIIIAVLLLYSSLLVKTSPQSGNQLDITYNENLNPQNYEFIPSAVDCEMLNPDENDILSFEDDITMPSYSLEDIQLEWNSTYGGDSGEYFHDAIEVSTGGFALIGSTYSDTSGYTDIWLVHTDELGNELWSRRYGGTSYDWGYGIIECSDGGFAIIGSLSKYDEYGDSYYEIWLIRTDYNGDVLWDKTYAESEQSDQDNGHDLVETEQGFTIVGETHKGQAMNILVIQTDLNGNHLWNKTFGGPSADGSPSIISCCDGGYAILGTTYSYGPGWADIWLLRIGQNGQLLWDEIYGGIDYDSGDGLVECTSGGFAIAGTTENFGAGGYDRWLIRTDATGVILWDQTYGGTGDETGWSIVENDYGGFALSGTNMISDSDYDGWIGITDEAGVLLVEETYGGPGIDQGIKIVKCADDGYLMAGLYNTADRGADGWLVRVSGGVETVRLNLKLTGEFDFLLKEDIHLQLAALVTERDSGKPITGATVTFTIYDPDGQTFQEGILAEQVEGTGVYIYIDDQTMKDLKVPKGIYLVIAEAQFLHYPAVTDMIQFHVDPPGETSDVPLILSAVFLGLTISGVIVYLFQRRIRFKL